MTNIRPSRRRGFGVLDSGFEDFYNVIDDFFNGSFTPTRAMDTASFKVDIEDTNDAYKITAELPGFDKDDIEITLEEGKLVISAAKEEEEKKEEKNYIHRERRTTSMSRTMFFKDIDGEGLKANLEQGVLSITVPKKIPEVLSKRIEIE